MGTSVLRFMERERGKRFMHSVVGTRREKIEC